VLLNPEVCEYYRRSEAPAIAREIAFSVCEYSFAQAQWLINLCVCALGVVMCDCDEVAGGHAAYVGRMASMPFDAVCRV
jgi:hypothetical protein